MKACFLFIFSFVIIFSAHSDVDDTSVFYVAEKKLPIELQIVIESYQKCSLSTQEKKNLTQIIFNIDLLVDKIKKDDFLYIVKIMTTKNLLRLKSLNNKQIDLSSLKEMRSYLPNLKTPLSKWLGHAIYRDMDLVFSSSAYKEYLSQRSEGELKSPLTKNISRKVLILSRLFSYFPIEQVSLEEQVKPYLLDILKNIEYSSYLFIKYTSNEPINFPSVGHYKPNHFSEQSSNKIKIDSTQKVSKEKTVESIIDGLISPQLDDVKPEVLPKSLPTPSNDADWLEDI